MRIFDRNVSFFSTVFAFSYAFFTLLFSKEERHQYDFENGYCAEEE